ncbi:hypothetical protein LMG8286_01231 [Campylobacter suis]|uniref:WG repeat-containing protein n=1 Tax=Campylobacter suis TaxID=2790657 RepID=A0ABM8Q617_9BACT|nr:hypothetical protein LMG8286_01231 [Campylobacter suis]
MIKGLSGCYFSRRFYYINADGFIVARQGDKVVDTAYRS